MYQTPYIYISLTIYHTSYIIYITNNTNNYYHTNIIHHTSFIGYPPHLHSTRGQGTCHGVKASPPARPHGPRHHAVRCQVAPEPGKFRPGRLQVDFP